jgi:hypothetical protein
VRSLARVLDDDVVTRCDHVVDLHSAVWEAVRPPRRRDAERDQDRNCFVSRERIVSIARSARAWSSSVDESWIGWSIVTIR